MSSSYKDSGFTWLGMIPVDWEIKKLKYLSSIIDGDRGSEYPNDKDLVDEGILFLSGDNLKEFGFDFKKVRFISEEKYNRLGRGKVQKGDIVVSVRGTIGSSGLFDSSLYNKAFINAQMMIIRINSLLDSRFLFYFTKTQAWTMCLNYFAYGTAQQQLSNKILAELPIAFPKLNIQKNIVCYLDNKLENINNLIRNKEKQRGLLEQQRQTIITEAVTKGLNPSVKMKESGVEWIGEIPEHWEVKKIKHFATHVGSGKTPSGGSDTYLDKGVPFLRSLNVHFDGIRLKDLAFISEEINEEMKSSQVQPLDILLNITGASIGRTTIVPKDFGKANVNQHVCIIRLNQNKVYPYYFNMLMASDIINQQIWFAQNGSSREGLNFAQIRELTFPIPPTLEEQREINEWIYNKQLKIFRLIDLVKEQIKKLKEYRQSLIYEAVTGKIDVRELELDKVR